MSHVASSSHNYHERGQRGWVISCFPLWFMNRLLGSTITVVLKTVDQIGYNPELLRCSHNCSYIYDDQPKTMRLHPLLSFTMRSIALSLFVSTLALTASASTPHGQHNPAHHTRGRSARGNGTSSASGEDRRATSPWHLVDRHAGASFFDGWNFFTDP